MSTRDRGRSAAVKKAINRLLASTQPSDRDTARVLAIMTAKGRHANMRHQLRGLNRRGQALVLEVGTR